MLTWFNPDLLIQYKSVVYIITILFTLGLVYWIYKKYNLTKYQLLVFVLLVLFWASINIIRAYRKIYATTPLEFGGMSLDGIIAANIVAAYGLVSIFVRLPVFMVSDYIKSRKIVIATALAIIMITSFGVVVSANATTLFASSLALGIGASILSLFNVMFAETFSTKDAIVSVSILSIAPLLAEFFVAPLQSILTANPIKNYDTLWFLSGVLALITLVFLWKIKDNKEPVRNFTWDKFKTVLADRRFLLICVLGIIVSFIRFASGQANMVAYARSELVLMDNFLVAYLDVIFTLFQLGAGVMAGLYLKKKIGTRNTLLFGLASTLAFTFIASNFTQQWILFLGYGLNGFGYGITYNILLGLALQPFAKEMREVSMGIYQTFFAIGIYYGDKIYAFVLQAFPTTFEGSALYQAVFSMLSWVTIALIGFIILTFTKKNRAFIES